MTVLFVLFAICVTLAAAVVEAHGYMTSFQALNGQVNGNGLLKAYGWYSLGIAIDFFALYLMSKSSVFVPEIMATIFMVSTIIGIAIMSGQFMTWKLVDQAVGVLVVAGVAWLTYRVDK
jgi:hypothetical protein